MLLADGLGEPDTRLLQQLDGKSIAIGLSRCVSFLQPTVVSRFGSNRATAV